MAARAWRRLVIKSLIKSEVIASVSYSCGRLGPLDLHLSGPDKRYGTLNRPQPAGEPGQGPVTTGR